VPNIEQKYLDWIFGRDTGTSSKTIWAVMTGQKKVVEGPFDASVPLDSDDFGRCHRLLLRFPEWRTRLQEVADEYPKWQTLVDEWDNLTAMYEEALETHEEDREEGNQKFAAMFHWMQELIRG
jgi:hypothetical protein